MFLKKGQSGNFYTVGGAQGRFEVRAGKIESISHASPVGQAHNGQSLEAFAAQVEAAAR